MNETGSLRLRVMKIRPKEIASTTVLAFCILITLNTPGQGTRAVGGGNAPTVLNRDEASAVLPATVFFRGKVAPTQARNSAGLRLPDGKLVLAAMVDASGYSSAIQEQYQAYLLTEEPLKVGDQRLPPGAYGFGFVNPDKMVVMDVGGNEILHTATERDEQLARPTPLQMIANGGGVRLYLGRRYVVLSPVGD